MRTRVLLVGSLSILMCLIPWPRPHADAGGPGTSVSYVDLTEKKDAAAFYRSAGASHAGKRIHIHVSAARIHAKPSRSFVTRTGVRYIVFENGKVPLVARPDDVYLKKARQRTTPKEELCIKGVVVEDGAPDRAGWVIRVMSVKTAP